jgi:hypothetical protein
MIAIRRPLLVGALGASIIVLVASAAVAVGTLGGPSSGPLMMGSFGQDRSAAMMLGPNPMQNQLVEMMGSQRRRPGAGMMGGSMMGSTSGMGMKGGMSMALRPGDGVAVSSMTAARARAATAGAPAGLHPGEVIWFDNGFYVELKDKAGQPATEVIVDPRSGAVSTEPGPAMMWNTRVGMHAHGNSAIAATGAVDATKARAIAASWLAANRAGTTIGTVDAYPGYFTMDLTRNGAVTSMMSVNSVTGAVWYHAWHGAFVAGEDS